MADRTPGTYAVFNTSEGTIVCKLFEKDVLHVRAKAASVLKRIFVRERLSEPV